MNKYTYTLIDLIPHKSVQYNIYCYYDDVFVKSITGLIEGKEYLEWINDDYLDNLIKTKINGDI